LRSAFGVLARGVASRKNIAIVALARKLLVTLWAMLRDHRRWRQPTIAAHLPPEDTAPVTALSPVAGAAR
jgi:hypothetical protein